MCNRVLAAETSGTTSTNLSNHGVGVGGWSHTRISCMVLSMFFLSSLEDSYEGAVTISSSSSSSSMPNGVGLIISHYVMYPLAFLESIEVGSIGSMVHGSSYVLNHKDIIFSPGGAYLLAIYLI